MTDEERFWSMVEAAWAPLGEEVTRARHELATRTPGPDDVRYGEPPFALLTEAMDDFVRNLATAAANLTSAELTDLDRVIERKLHDIDRADVQEVTDGSDDGFLYARGFIVALGREFYDAVVRDPRMAILDADCEEICYLFAHLHHKRFGAFPETGSGITRESCSNPAGWPAEV
ncbi:DUF4240 domain-containing protein [Spirillospora sp. CA-294931]|uniref:DUF4240 domain-containing protein n=1 Tax=Spirillospora sp. CA-294931 TaxID=3240042 RepID=UPI003D93B76C